MSLGQKTMSCGEKFCLPDKKPCPTDRPCTWSRTRVVSFAAVTSKVGMTKSAQRHRVGARIGATGSRYIEESLVYWSVEGCDSELSNNDFKYGNKSVSYTYLVNISSGFLAQGPGKLGIGLIVDIFDSPNRKRFLGKTSLYSAIHDQFT